MSRTDIPDEPSESGVNKGGCKIVVCALLVLVCVASMLSLVVKYDLVEREINYVDENDLGVWGGVIYVSVFVGSSVLVLPQTFLEIAAGVIWSHSFVAALTYAWFAKMISSCLCFVIARGAIGGNPGSSWQLPQILVALKKVIKQKPDLLTALVCAAYIPAFIKNYGLGAIPDVKFFRHFVPWTSICGLPFSAANVFLGLQAESLSVSSPKDNATAKIMLVCFGVVTIVGLTVLGYFTKRQLQVQIDLLSDDNGDGCGRGTIDNTRGGEQRACYGSLGTRKGELEGEKFRL